MKPILVVDDNERMVCVLEACVKKEGFDCISAFDGEEALSKFKQFNPSLILLDIMIPKMDGLEVCKAVRNESDTPVIIISAKSEDEDIIKGFMVGADDYVTKPFSPKLVMMRIKAVLRRTGNREK